MNYADRIKEATTTTGTGSIVLGGAYTGYRTFASVLSAADRVPYCIEDADTGDWETGLGTLTDTTHLARTLVLASSNAGALVSFAAGTKSVFCTATAEMLDRGLVDPDDVGFDIVLCLGQSNMCGRGTLDTSIDAIDSRVWQFGGASGATSPLRYQQIFPGVDPIHNAEGINTGYNSPQSSFGTAYVQTKPANRRVLLVPCAYGGTALVSGSHEWQVGSSLANNAISQANLAITAAQAIYQNSRFVGCIWHQGEADQIAGTTQAAYVAALEDLIAELRTEVTSASESWFVIGGMAPGFISSGYGTGINLAHIQVASETDRCWYVAGPSGKDDALHYTAAGLRILGPSMALAVRSAESYTATDIVAPTASSAAVANATPTYVDITLSEAMDTAYTPVSSAVTVSGHTVTALAYTSTTNLRATVSAAFVNGEAARTAAYTQPGTNNARDLAGNLLATFSGLAITNNVAGAATGVTMTGPSGGVESVASTNFSIGVTPIGGVITGTVVVTPADGGDGGTFTPTTVSLTSGSPTATFTYTPASVGAKTISVTNNGGLTNPSNITYTATSADVTAPTFSSAQVANAAPSDIVITMSETLGASTPPTSAFAVSGGKTVTGTSRSGATVTVTVNTAYAYGDTITVTYTAPGSNPRIQDPSSNITASFGPSSVTNNISAPAMTLGNLGFMAATTPDGDYVGTTGSFWGNEGRGTLTIAAQSGVDFEFIVQMRDIPLHAVNGKGMGIGIDNSNSNAVDYSTVDYFLMHRSDGCLPYTNGSSGTADNTVLALQNDYVRLRRTGSTLVMDVSQNAGSSYTTVKTISSISTGAYYLRVHAMYDTLIRLISSSGLA